MTLKQRFEKLVKEYLVAFEIKQSTQYECNVDNDPGGVHLFSDYYLTFDVVRYDIDNNIPVGKVFEWYDYSIEKNYEKLPYSNYANFCKGAVI